MRRLAHTKCESKTVDRGLSSPDRLASHGEYKAKIEQRKRLIPIGNRLTGVL